MCEFAVHAYGFLSVASCVPFINLSPYLQPGEYTLDFEWYLSTQILPPISRLCEPIEGTSPAILSERLGLDAAKYAR